MEDDWQAANISHGHLRAGLVSTVYSFQLGKGIEFDGANKGYKNIISHGKQTTRRASGELINSSKFQILKQGTTIGISEPFVNAHIGLDLIINNQWKHSENNDQSEMLVLALYNQKASSSFGTSVKLPFRRSTGNDVSGTVFSPFFSTTTFLLLLHHNLF